MQITFRLGFDRRHFRWWWQRRTRGFDDRELWSLDATIARFILPRLRSFAASTSIGGNLEDEPWHDILDKMIVGLEHHADVDNTAALVCPPEVDEGMELFGEYFGHLWY